MSEPRDPTKPFYLAIIECRAGEIDCGDEPAHDFDTQDQAFDYLKDENEAYGVGGHVFHCTPVASIAAIDVPDPDEPEAS